MMLGHGLLSGVSPAFAHSPRQESPAGDVAILNPRDRVPLSFVIDDSTCLVNMGHFCTPQFAAAFPDRAEYKRPWRDWPREIPDSFVREFGEWCAAQGVKGKYSIVPNPACVGWLDRELPGWSRGDLEGSLQLVRDLMLPNWDIHPEMITHTRVIDLKTGRPFPEIGPATIENSYPRVKKSTDEIAAYLAYALRILKNCGLPCEGITTPGGFGNVMKSELSLAVQQAVNDVFAPEIPHYFKYVHTGEKSTEPILEHVRKTPGAAPDVTVNVPAGTGDWFGGWQGVNPVESHRYCNEDATAGRMVELIQREQPAVMLCHWPGMYCNGSLEGFREFQRVVTALDDRFGQQTLWMKMSEIARYWAVRQFADVQRVAGGIEITTPFACPKLTIRVPVDGPVSKVISTAGDSVELTRVTERHRLDAGAWYVADRSIIACVDIPKGRSGLALRAE